MTNGRQAREHWANWMAMFSSLDNAQIGNPKAEWEDLRCYVLKEYADQREAELTTLAKQMFDMLHCSFITSTGTTSHYINHSPVCRKCELEQKLKQLEIK